MLNWKQEFRDNKLEKQYIKDQRRYLYSFLKWFTVFQLLRALISFTQNLLNKDYIGILLPISQTSSTLVAFGMSKVKQKKISLILSILNVFYAATEVVSFATATPCNTQITYIRADSYMIIHIFLLSSPKFLENTVTWVLIVLTKLSIQIQYGFDIQQINFTLSTIQFSYFIYEKNRTQRMNYLQSKNQDIEVTILKDLSLSAIIKIIFNTTRMKFIQQLETNEFIKMFDNIGANGVLKQILISKGELLRYPFLKNNIDTLQDLLYRLYKWSAQEIGQGSQQLQIEGYMIQNYVKKYYQITINTFSHFEEIFAIRFVVKDDLNQENINQQLLSQQFLLKKQFCKFLARSLNQIEQNIKYFTNPNKVSLDLKEYIYNNFQLQTKLMFKAFEIQSYKLAFNYRPTNLIEIIRQLSMNLEYQCKRKNLFIMPIDNNTPQVVTDRLAMQLFWAQFLGILLDQARPRQYIKLMFSKQEKNIFQQIVRIIQCKLVLKTAKQRSLNFQKLDQLGELLLLKPIKIKALNNNQISEKCQQKVSIFILEDISEMKPLQL